MDLDDYDRRWETMVADGRSVHGEIDFVERLVPNRLLSILDAGCGTGRLAIEAARRGHRVVGVDLDSDMVDRARTKAPHVEWQCADIAQLALDEMFDVAVMAGNIPLFCAPGAQRAIISSLARHLVAGGVLVCGFTLEDRRDSYSGSDFEQDARSADLEIVSRFSTWEGDPSRGDESDDYAVIVCRRSSAEITSR